MVVEDIEDTLAKSPEVSLTEGLGLADRKTIKEYVLRRLEFVHGVGIAKQAVVINLMRDALQTGAKAERLAYSYHDDDLTVCEKALAQANACDHPRQKS
jgi:hypothetical protein